MNTTFVRRPFRSTYYNAAFVLIGLNILVFVVTYVWPRTLFTLALSPVMVMRRGAYWQFLTYMFAHGGMSHILFNMLGLFFFGAAVERRMGSTEFVIFYLTTGVAAGFFSFLLYVFSRSYGVLLLGASGAVYAVLLAYATYYPDSTIYVMALFPVRAPYLVLGFTAIAVASQLFSFNTGVAHLTHLAGFVFAFLYFVVRFAVNPLRVFFGSDRHRWH